MKAKRIVPNTETADLSNAAAFYREILGLDLIMDHGWFQRPAFIACSISVLVPF